MSILDLSFNDNTSCLVVGHNSGFTIFGLKPSLEKRVSTELNGGIGIARLLRSTNILCLVGGGDEPYRAKDHVIVWNDHRKSKSLGIELNEPIKNIHVTNQKIIIVLENRVCIAALNNGDISYMKDTFTNEKGICKYSYKNESLVVATLGSIKGEIAIWKLKSDEYSTIQAHNNNVVAIEISQDGSLVATASECGTNVHVFSTETGKMLYKFRRGTSSATIYDIAIDNSSKQLACCSDHGTVHIWDLCKNEESSGNRKSFFAPFGDYMPFGGEYLKSLYSREPIEIGDLSESILSFDEEDVLHVVTKKGNYFRIDETDGKYNQPKRRPLHINQG
jgi:WD40 repeat protein